MEMGKGGEEKESQKRISRREKKEGKKKNPRKKEPMIKIAREELKFLPQTSRQRQP